MTLLLRLRVPEPHRLVPIRKLGPESHLVVPLFEGLGERLLEIRELSLLLRRDSAEVAVRKKHVNCFAGSQLKIAILDLRQLKCLLLRGVGR